MRRRSTTSSCSPEATRLWNSPQRTLPHPVPLPPASTRTARETPRNDIPRDSSSFKQYLLPFLPRVSPYLLTALVRARASGNADVIELAVRRHESTTSSSSQGAGDSSRLRTYVSQRRCVPAPMFPGTYVSQCLTLNLILSLTLTGKHMDMET